MIHPRSIVLPSFLALAALAASPVTAQPGCTPLAVPLDTASFQAGRLTSMGNGRARLSYQYDQLGREARVAYALEGTTWVFTDAYGYPQNPGSTSGPGTVLRSATFPDGEVASYTYDAAGVRQTVTAIRPGQAAQAILNAVRRNARGQTIQVSFGNGAVTTRSYNDSTDLRLREIATAIGANTVQRLTYGFDADGNATSVTDGVIAGYSATYGYDSLDQLTGMGGSVAGTYAYDGTGNLIAKDGVAQTYGGAGRGPHALAAAGGVSYLYDDNGNVASTSAGLALTWNSDNLATRATLNGVEKNRKSFLADQLWKKVENGITTYYLPSLLVENGACRKLYDALAERSPDGSLQFYHPDHLGSSTVTTSAAQQVSHRVAYLPWGEDRGVAAGSFLPRYQFNFKEKEATGLYDYGARLYNPATGRWMSADPLTADGLNRYAYVRNSPVNRIDPSGMQSAGPATATGPVPIPTPKDQINTGAWGYFTQSNNLVAAFTPIYISNREDLKGLKASFVKLPRNFTYTATNGTSYVLRPDGQADFRTRNNEPQIGPPPPVRGTLSFWEAAEPIRYANFDFKLPGGLVELSYASRRDPFSNLGYRQFFTVKVDAHGYDIFEPGLSHRMYRKILPISIYSTPTAPKEGFNFKMTIPGTPFFRQQYEPLKPAAKWQFGFFGTSGFKTDIGITGEMFPQPGRFPDEP